MKTYQLLDGVMFNQADENGHAEALQAGEYGRALRWGLLPGQSIRPHKAPSTPVYIVVLQGKGYFSGSDDVKHELGPLSLAVFEPGEIHTVRAANEQLVFLSILHEAPIPQHGG